MSAWALLALASWAAAAPIETPSELRLQAIELFREGRYREAARNYELEVSSRPHDLEVLRDSVWAFWYSGQYGRTAQQGLRIIEKLPEDLEALNLTARALLITRRRRRALEIYLRSLEVDSEQREPRRAVARIYEWLRDYEPAVRHASELLIDDPADASAQALIGRSRFFQERYGQSARAWAEASSLDPENLHYKISLAHALYFAGRKAEASALARKILEEDPRYWPAVDFVASVSLLERRPREAFAALETALERFVPEDSSRLMRLARLYELHGRRRRFLRTIDRLLRSDPADPEALLALASDLTRHGRAEEASELYRRALAWEGTREDGLSGLARALSVSSRAFESLETLSRARALSPSDPALLLMESHELYRLGRHRRAKRLLLEWLDNDAVESPALVLRYHGLTPRADDPVLANPMHMTTEAFAAQIAALRDAGFTTIRAEQLARWEARDGSLPPRALLLIFEDARLDTLRRADKILRRHGFKAAVSVDRKAVDAESPLYPRWSDLRALERRGRWELLVEPLPRRASPRGGEREPVDLDWNPAVTIEAEPRADWNGERVTALLWDKDPRLRVRRTLLARAAWEKKPREALYWLKENREAGAPADILLADEARIRWSVGDRARGLQLARRALSLDREPEHELLVEDFLRKLRPALTTSVRYLRDNRERSSLRFDQSLGAFALGRHLVTALHGVAFYREAERETIEGHSGGLEVSRGVGLRGTLEARALAHFFPGAPRAFSGHALWRSRWADRFDSELEGGQALYATARALDAGVRERYGALGLSYLVPDGWNASGRLSVADISDDNERFTAQLRLSHPLSGKLPSLRLLSQLAVDTTRRMSVNYYSPQALIMTQLGLQFLPQLSERLRAELTYLPGYGVENGVEERFVHRFDAALSARWGERFFARPFVALTRSPLYRSESFGAALGARF